MRLFFKILKLLPAILIILIIIEIAFDPLNLMYKRDKDLKHIEPRNRTEEGITQKNSGKGETQKADDLGGKENGNDIVSDQVENGEKEAADSENSENLNGTKKSKNYFMTFDEVVSIENISLRDKITGLSIMSKLKKEEIKKLLDIANGGITMTEFESVKQFLEKSLNRDDYKTLNELLLRNKRLYAEGKLTK